MRRGKIFLADGEHQGDRGKAGPGKDRNWLLQRFTVSLDALFLSTTVV